MGGNTRMKVRHLNYRPEMVIVLSSCASPSFGRPLVPSFLSLYSSSLLLVGSLPTMSGISSGVADQLKLQLPSWLNMMQLIGFSKDFFELVRDIGEAKSKEVANSF